MLRGTEHCGAWHRKPLGTGVSGDPPLENGNARSPGQSGSAAQNAVALLVHRAGLEQQRNTKAKVSRHKRRTRHGPGFVLGNQAGAPALSPPSAALGDSPNPTPGAGWTRQTRMRRAPVPPRAFTGTCARRAEPAAGGPGRPEKEGVLSLPRHPCPLEGERPRPATPPPPSRPPAASAPGRHLASHRVGVECRERGPRRRCRTGPGWVVRWRRRRRLPQQSRVRLQRQLQVQDVVDNVLQDLHFADFLVGRDGGHQPPQAAVAVVHIALQAQRRLVGRRLRRLAARCRRRGRRGRRATQAVAVLSQAAQSQLPTAAARRRLAARGAHRAHRLHRARPAPCASGPAGASEGGRQAPGPRPRPAPLPLPSRPARSVRARGTAKLPGIPRPGIDGRVAPGFARGSLLSGRHSAGTKRQEKSRAPEGKQPTAFPRHSLRSSDYSPAAAAAALPYRQVSPQPDPLTGAPPLRSRPASRAAVFIEPRAPGAGPARWRGRRESRAEPGWARGRVRGGRWRGRRLRAALGGGEPGNPSGRVGGGSGVASQSGGRCHLRE